MPLHLVPLLSSLLLAAPAAATQSTAEQAAMVADGGMLKVKIKRGSKTLKHPGHKVESGEELVLVLREGDKRTHEVTVYVESTEEGYKFEVTYTDNGKKIVKGETNAKPKQWVTLKSEDGKSSVSVHLDPSGNRPNKVELPDGNNPLDGVK